MTGDITTIDNRVINSFQMELDFYSDILIRTTISVMTSVTVKP